MSDVGARSVGAFGCLLLLVGIGGCTAATPGTAANALSLITPDRLCPDTGTGREDAEALVSCSTDTVSAYWSAELGQPVDEVIVVAPDPATVAENCRAFLSFGTAFFCPADATVYITDAALDRDALAFGGSLPYAMAGIVAHEIAHVVQDVVDQPEFEDNGSDAQSRVVEQQADCLVGVWAVHAAAARQLNPGGFRVAYELQLTIIGELPIPPGSDLEGYDEVATHGTVAERMAAYDTGAAGGSGVACGLVGIA